ncbi:MAG: pyridoxamine 5'-phosphate oxidase family protein [Clostridia bacterium]|nr:pyridoxamine 5'-phosphate oxidase family protein [Clostridia bacterium]
MQEIYEFLKKCGTYYLATSDGDQCRVRPFGTIDCYDGRLTIQTGRRKDVAAQIFANPKIELCAFDGETWLRLTAVAEEDPRVEAQQHMLDSYPDLKGMYQAGDGNTCVFALKSGKAVFASFTAAPRTVEF